MRVILQEFRPSTRYGVNESQRQAAKRAGVTELVFPKENAKDFAELPAHIRKGLKPNFVGTFKEVVDVAFGKAT